MALASVLAIFVAACGDGNGGDSESAAVAGGQNAGTAEWQAIVKAAKKEGSVSLYAARVETDVVRMIGEFHKVHPDIKVNYVVLPSLAMLERVDQELAAGRLGADVTWNAEIFRLQEHVAKHELLPIVGPAASEWDPKQISSGLVPLVTDPYGFAYNTDIITKDPPTDWNSLATDDRFRGRIVMQEVNGSAVVGFYRNIERLAGGDWLNKIAQLGPVRLGQSGTIAQSTAAGETAAGVFVELHSVTSLKDQGAPIEYVFPKSGTFAAVQYGGVWAKAKHPNAGRVFLDFLMSRQGQEDFVAGGRAYSRLNLPEGYHLDPGKLTYLAKQDSDPAALNAYRTRFAHLFSG